MVFLSELLGAEVVDLAQRRVGRVRDVVATSVAPYPVVTGLVVGRHGEAVIPWASVRTYAGREISLRTETSDVRFETVPDPALWLARDVLDQQVIDTDGRRVVRVNDLQLVEAGGRMLLVAADIGTRGLLRRLGIEKLGKAVVRVARRELPMVLVSWDVVQPLRDSGGDPLRLTISEDRIGKMHPADIADIVEELSAKQRHALFEGLTDEVAADTLEEMEPEEQVSVIEHMDSERASEILDEMPPDEVADILADLSQERADELLSLMQRDEAEDVQELLLFGEDTAGGLMTTEYVAVPIGLSAQECIDELRRLEPEAESVYYVYVIDAEERLQGVLSLRDLIVARPDAPIRDFMHEEVVRVGLDAHPEEIAAVITKYNLLAVPVADEESRLRGIVTVDDALDRVLPEGIKRRLPRAL